jgi:hypothetical protein
MQKKRSLKFSMIIAGSVAGAAMLAAVPAQAQNPVGEVLGTAAAIASAPFVWGGHNYCWYPDGWRGPGWYWCGYAHRHGYGWGGPEGWHGWHRRGHMEHGHMGGHMGGHPGGHMNGHMGGHDHHMGGHSGDHSGGHDHH